MRILTKSLLAGALAISSVGLVTMVSAKPFGEGPGCGRGGYQMGPGQHFGGRGPSLERMAYRLNLTDEQRSQMEGILDGSRQGMDQLRDKMQANRNQLRDLTQQTPLDEAAVRSVADEQGDLKADMIVLRTQRRSEIRAVLNDEQRAQLDEMRKGKQFRVRSN